MNELDAFRRHITVAGSGCHEWNGPRTKDGYGRFTFEGHQSLAHRAAWRLFRGLIGNGMCVLHRCDNPPCVNPDHLFLGDRGDNARDMAAKGRQHVQQHPELRPQCPPELLPRGSRHGNALLTEAQVLAIRERAFNGELGKHLAAEFGVSTSLISAIVRGQFWRHVGGPIRPYPDNQEPRP